MSATAFNVVLFAALLHATWNAIVKGSGDKLLTTVLITIFAAAISALLLPFLAVPAPASRPYLIASAVLQTGYFSLVAATYRAADMSLAYPLMRGAAPLIVTLVSAMALGETLSPGAWNGILLICAGVLTLASTAQGADRRGILFASTTACVIAAYTLVDGAGVRLSGAPAAYTLWLNLLTGLPFGLWLLVARPPSFRHYLRRNWPFGLIGGFGTLLSYGLALWAMTQAPVPVVSALRETSILFGAAISALVLKEDVGLRQIGVALMILAGAIFVRLS